MTHEQFIEWIDEQMEFCEPRAKNEEMQNGKSGNYWTGQMNLYRQVREKFLTLTPPPTTLS